LAALSASAASAQSLSINSPAPLQPGVNESQTDNLTGTHYWYFYGGPGKVYVHCVFKGGGLLGAAMNAPLSFTLSDAAGTWHTTGKLVSGSTADVREVTFPGTLKSRTKIIVSVMPIAGGLVRTGGTYDISLSGVVSYGAKKSGDPIVGTMMQMSGMTSNYGATKFKADGTVLASTGATGTWKLFDADTHTYTVVLDGQRLSLIFMPGRGLVSADDTSNVVFKALK
jgi:WD40 repeat protein